MLRHLFSNKTDKYQAFTLIEILVVVGLIAILAAITIVALNPSKTFSKSRNVERWNGIRAIHKGLEQWIIDGNGVNTLTEGDGSQIADCGVEVTDIMDQPTVANGQVDLDAELVSTYIVEVPRDPVNASGSNTGYKLCKFNNPVRFLILAPSAELSEVISMPTEYDTLDAGLVGYWKMDESSWNGTGDEVVDSSESLYHGVSVNGATTTTGQVGQAGFFDESNSQHVDLGNIGVTTGYISVAGWIYADTYDSQDGRIFSKATGDQEQDHTFMFSIYNITGEHLRVRLRTDTCGASSTTTIIGQNTTMVSGQWYHVAFTYDQVSTRFYLNGEFRSSSNSATGALCTSSDSVFIGGNPGSNNNYWDGKIDELRLYNRALDDVEIERLADEAP